MATSISQGHQLYLYQLLSRELGCGKQTFLPRVEEVLAADDILPTDLDAADALELLEKLDGFVSLTVFKGARVYVTVNRNQEWDALLEKADDGDKAKSAAKGGKSWKRGKKSARPVKPKHKKAKKTEKSAEPAGDPVSTEAAESLAAAGQANDSDAAKQAEAVAGAEAATDAGVATSSEVATDAAAAEAATSSEATASPEASADTDVLKAPAKDEASTARPEASASPATAAETETEPPVEKPSISFTITYDPAGAVSSGKQSAAPTEVPAAQRTTPAPAAAPAPTPAAPVACAPADAAPPAGYPHDFSTEVFCPSTLLHELSLLLPFGADAMGIANEYYWIALERGTLERSRSRFAFPLRYSDGGARRTVIVRVRKRSEPRGLPWGVDAIEAAEE